MAPWLAQSEERGVPGLTPGLAAQFSQPLAKYDLLNSQLNKCMKMCWE